MIPYGHQHWLRLLAAPRGAFSPGVLGRVILFTALSALSTSLHLLEIRPLTLPIGFHEVAGAVIALVLAFRTNTAYARFWEARTLWGGIVNASRNLSRLVHAQAGISAEQRRSFDTYIVLFAHGTRRRLRHESLEPEARRLLSGRPLQALLACDHVALHSAQELSDRIATFRADGQLETMSAQLAESHVASLVDRLGGCERIHRTPTPLGYVALLRQLTVVFLSTLPFALVERVGWFMPLLSGVVAYPILMIEGLGNELDDPFGHDANDLPLERICSTIEHDLIGGGRPPPERAMGVERPQD